MAITADAVVVGGGVIGASTLFHLCALGARRVLLCERRQPGAGASGKSGAFIQLHFCLNLPEVQLTLASLPYFRQWADLVGAGACGFVPAGYLRLEPTEREVKLRGQVALLQPLGVQTSAIEPDEIARLAPYLRLDGVAVAAYEPTSGYADANTTLAGFLAAAGQRGGEVLTETTVTAVRVVSGRAVGVETTAGPIDAPIVVLAAGAWSPPLLRDLGLSVPIAGALTQWLGFAVPSLPQEMMTVGDGVSGSYFRATTPGAREILIGLGGMGRQPLGDPDADTGAVPEPLVTLASERLAARTGRRG
jgi:sarcosine oxidase subunit beta